jgi:hypothetical protein
MANKYNEYPFLRKVVLIFTVFWAISCAGIYWSMRHAPGLSPRFYLLFAGIPIAIAWALAMTHKWVLALTALPEELERKIKDARKQRNKPG